MTTWNDIQSELGGALGRVVASYTPPGPDREDLAQEVAISIIQAIARFRGDSSLKTYVLRVAHNVGLRHAMRRRQLPEPRVDIEDHVADGGAGPLRLVLDRGEHDRLQAAIRALPIAQRQVLALALEDLDHAAIAETLGITENAVATRLNRAKTNLKILLEIP